MTITEAERLILHYVARETENRADASRWVVYAIPHDRDVGPRWAWDDYRPLVDAGLLERRESWKHVYVRLTDAGWKTLMTTAPDADLCPQCRGSLGAMTFDGVCAACHREYDERELDDRDRKGER
jgi:hypothetical protein